MAEVLAALARRLGVDVDLEVGDGFDWSFPLVSALVDQGANLLVQVDGERDGDLVTVLLSGSLLEGDFIRREGRSVGATLAEVLCAFALEWPDQA